MAALVSIGSYDFPEPSTYSGTTSTIVDSARNVQGIMIGSVVRNDVAKIEMTWRYLTAEQWSQMLKMFTPALGGQFINETTFLDQVRNGYVTRKMYVSDRTAGMWRRNSDTGEVMGYTDCRIALIEV